MPANVLNRVKEGDRPSAKGHNDHTSILARLWLMTVGPGLTMLTWMTMS